MGDAAGDQEPARVLARRREPRPGRLTRSFLIVHGLEGSGPEHWQSWLAPRLRERGDDVRYPDLPEPFDPDPGDWLAVLRSELEQMSGERIVMCHSLGCLLWMRHAAEIQQPAAERVLLVAPPCTQEVPAVVRFRTTDVDAATLARAAPTTLMVCSDDDPWCPAGAESAFPGVFENVQLIPGGAHLNTDAGYGPWPFAEDWALGR